MSTWSSIAIAAFVAMYALACCLEIARALRGHSTAAVARRLTILAVALHTIFLAGRVISAVAERGMPLANWSDWCQVAAWLLALIFVLVAEKRPAFGVFLLPLVLSLVCIGALMPDEAEFQKAQAARWLGLIHGLALMVGTVTVLFGFSAGAMYLLQSHRLKQKRTSRFRLPSLEYLQRANEMALLYSVLFLMIGLATGFVLNVAIGRSSNPVPLTDPTVLISVVLAAWLAAASLFAALYRPVMHSRKVAYLTVASFVAFALTMAIVLFGPSAHARKAQEQASVAANEPRSNAGEVDLDWRVLA